VGKKKRHVMCECEKGCARRRIIRRERKEGGERKTVSLFFELYKGKREASN
jgi:hypothetical protein